ncbi:unnamed protein product [Didymodactylos carnosus]|uniref:MULE transposase domain-containing protein n=4 Tax=Didymodactylos carnosus TaxID=1234261 RepID=A0A8S2JY82_9BILA|nr:unnamed protein product [Didymodactylos carnosus]CAF3828934.1 unnamed protein product [Didymodactylos carnosus]
MSMSSIRFEESYEIVVPDNDVQTVTVMSRGVHEHKVEERNTTTRLLSPVRKSVSKYIKCGLSHTQIKSSLVQDHPSTPLTETKLRSLVNYERRKNRPEIFSVFDLRNWCNEHSEGKQIHSTFVPFYTVDDINNTFVFFTTKQLFQQIRLTTYLQVDATYKITWNELPMLVFGSTDANRHFKPFGIALVSHDENAKCYNQLFTSINALAVQEFNHPCSIDHLMADGALGITCAQQTVFPQSRRMMCWFHMIQKCRLHRNLVTKEQWVSIDADLHAIQLSFSDDVFNRGITLLIQKWSANPLMKNFSDYFVDQWVTKLPFWYEGAAYGKPSTNNGCESMNAVIKQKYTLRNKLQLSAFLPKMEQMLQDWSEASISSPFALVTSISLEAELHAYKWSFGWICIGLVNGHRSMVLLNGRHHVGWFHRLRRVHVPLVSNNIHANTPLD